MLTIDTLPARLTDEELLAEVPRLAARERQSTADLIAGLAELDERRLYVAEGCSSLFAYCTKRLHLLEDAAWHRVEAARAVRRFPVVLERMRDGALTLTAVRLLARHLTDDNCERLLAWAAGRTKREIEEQVAAIAPRPDLPSSVRKVPARADAATGAVAEDRSVGLLPGSQASERLAAAAGLPAVTDAVPVELLPVGAATTEAGASPGAGVEPGSRVAASAPPPRPEIRALAPARYSLRITMSGETHAKLQRARALLRHQIPSGDPAAVVERALTHLVDHLERTKFAAKKSRPPAKEATGGRRAPRRPADPREKTSSKAAQPAHPPASARPDSLAPQAEARQASPPPSPAQTPPRSARRSRYIPAAVKRAVWERDAGQCAFVGRGGRCSETGFLEFHHRVPYAEGGQPTVGNLMLACKTHNRHEASRWFGLELEERGTRQGTGDRHGDQSYPSRDG